MQYELTTIDEIMVGLHHAITETHELPADAEQQINTKLPLAVKAIKSNMLTSVAAHPQRENAALYVSHHTRAISSHCELLYTLYRLQFPETKKMRLSVLP